MISKNKFNDILTDKKAVLYKKVFFIFLRLNLSIYIKHFEVLYIFVVLLRWGLHSGQGLTVNCNYYYV